MSNSHTTLNVTNQMFPLFTETYPESNQLKLTFNRMFWIPWKPECDRRSLVKQGETLKNFLLRESGGETWKVIKTSCKK